MEAAEGGNSFGQLGHAQCGGRPHAQADGNEAPVHNAIPAAKQPVRLDLPLSPKGSSAAQTPPSASRRASSRRVTGRARQPSRPASRESERLASALLLSVLAHSLLLNLTFGGQGLGRPGFGFPWGNRRIEVPDLRLVLFPTHTTAADPVKASVAEPLQQAAIEEPAASVPTAPPRG